MYFCVCVFLSPSNTKLQINLTLTIYIGLVWQEVSFHPDRKIHDLQQTKSRRCLHFWRHTQRKNLTTYLVWVCRAKSWKWFPLNFHRNYKNPAYGRHYISWRLWIVAPISRRDKKLSHFFFFKDILWCMTHDTWHMTPMPTNTATNPPPAKSHT